MRSATRLERAQVLAAAAQYRAAGQSERTVAAGVGRPRSTLREWAQAAVASAEVPDAVVPRVRMATRYQNAVMR